MKITKKTKEKIAFTVLIITGIGLCIGGIWFPPLLVIGGPMIAGGLAILSNYLQDKDRFTINHNYGDIEVPKVVRTDIIRATPKQKLAALFAFNNRKYAMHSDHPHVIKNDDIDDKKENTHKHVDVDQNVVEEIQTINDLINSMDFEELKKCADEYNISQEDEINSMDKHKRLTI